MRTKTLAIIMLIAVILASCAPANIAIPTETAIPHPTSTNAPLPLRVTPARPLATPTDIQLPFNDKNIEHEYCQLPAVQLPISEAQGLSDDEIARKLMELFLEYFFAPQAPDYCRVDDYRIDKVYYDERTPSLSLEPKGDFMRVVQYSIKLIQLPNMWMSASGEIDQKNWLHTGNNVAVFRSADGYTMKFAYP